MEIKIGAVLGRGNTADVFDLGGGRALKLFHAGYPFDVAEREYELSKLFSSHGIDAAVCYEIVKYDDKVGIVYDALMGKTLLDILIETFDVEKCARLLANLHKSILSHTEKRAPLCNEVLRNYISGADVLSQSRKTRILALLDELPEGDTLCHGDFHFGNVLMCGERPYVIDFLNVCRGDMKYDVARTVYLIEFTPVPPNFPMREKVLRDKTVAADIYLDEMGVKRESIMPWLVVIFAARLAELGGNHDAEKENIIQWFSSRGL